MGQEKKQPMKWTTAYWESGDLTAALRIDWSGVGGMQGILRGRDNQAELAHAAEAGCVPGGLLPGWEGWIHAMGLGRVYLGVIRLPRKRIHPGSPSSVALEYGEESREF